MAILYLSLNEPPEEYETMRVSCVKHGTSRRKLRECLTIESMLSPSEVEWRLSTMLDVIRNHVNWTGERVENVIFGVDIPVWLVAKLHTAIGKEFPHIGVLFPLYIDDQLKGWV